MHLNYLLLSILLFLASAQGHCQRGIAVAVSDKYMPTCFPSLVYLRDCLSCSLPIEIWYSGDELSQASKDVLSILDCTFKDISQEYEGDPASFRGYHIKPLMLAASEFDEILLLDADSFFLIDPAILFDTPQYIETGTYFFRDRLEVKFCAYKKQPKFSASGDWTPGNKYEPRETFLRSMIDAPSQFVPVDWRHYWTDERPSLNHPICSEHQDSSCVAMDKRRHAKGVEMLVKLNTELREKVYSLVHGDKETFWLALEMAKEPYYVNNPSPYRLYGQMHESDKERPTIEMLHFINGKLFFVTKPPIELGDDPILVNSVVPLIWDLSKPSDDKLIPITKKIRNQLEHLYLYVEAVTR